MLNPVKQDPKMIEPFMGMRTKIKRKNDSWDRKKKLLAHFLR